MPKNSEFPSPSEALRQFDSPTVANAIEAFSVRDPVSGYASMELRCQFLDQEPMVGYAVTCTADSTMPGDRRPKRLVDLIDVVDQAPEPVVLVIKYVGQDRVRSCFQKLGGVGIVTDSGFRDRAGIAVQAPNVQLFTPGTVVSHDHDTFLDFNVTVSICGLTIQPSDLLHGDVNGLLSVPIDIAADVADQAAVIREAESAYMDFLRSDGFTSDELKRRLSRHGQGVQTPRRSP